MAINQTAGLREVQDGHLAFPGSLTNLTLFDSIKPFLVVGLISHNGKKKKKKVKIHFLQSPVIRAPTLLVRSYRHCKNFMSFLETITFTDVLCRQARTTNKRIGFMRLNRLQNMTTMFMIFLSDVLLASNLCFQI